MDDENENIADCIKYLKAVKPIFESYGFDWDKLISEEYTDQNSLLNRVGDTISFNITPKRRIDALNKIDELKGYHFLNLNIKCKDCLEIENYSRINNFDNFNELLKEKYIKL